MNDRQARRHALSEWLLEFCVLRANSGVGSADRRWSHSDNAYRFERNHRGCGRNGGYSASKGRRVMQIDGTLVSALNGVIMLIVGLVIT